VTATVTLTDATFADPIEAANFTAKAGDKVTVTVTMAEKKSDTEATLTLSVKAAEGAQNGTVSVMIKADALANSEQDLGMPAVAYTVKQEQTPPNPPVGEKDPTAKLAGEAITVTAGETTTATATVTLTDGTFAGTIAAANFAAEAGDGVNVTVTSAARTSDTVATLTLSMTAAAGTTAGEGTVSVTVNADAVKDYDKAISATGTLTYTVKEAAPVYFTSFVASEDLDDSTKESGSGKDYVELTSKDGLVTMDRSKYQLNTQEIDGNTYTARVKVNKSNASTNKGALTITHVKVGAILRIDGGNASGDVRSMNITGADETVWEASALGSFYLTATAETVVLESMTNEFCIYGIHVVDKKVAEKAVGEPVMTYEKPTLTLSAPSVAQGGVVTVTATIPQATKTTTYSTGRVESEKFDVNADITYAGEGVTVTDGKVDTSTQGTLAITASYTVDDQTYTSESVTLEVTKSFESKEAQIKNNDNTLGLTATDVTSADATIATAALSDNKDNIVITSIAQGETVITVSDGTKTAKIDVTVKASGEIETTVHKYASSVTVAYDATEKQFNDTTIVLGDGSHNNTKVSATYDGVTYTAGYKMESSSKITLVLSANADIYFVAAGDKTLKIDNDTAWEVNKLIEDVAAGTYELTNGKGSSQTSVCAVVITYK
ncbi:MAG: hypothetical protein K2I74_05925, partial [Treponemataceae bacterium]|nr:hypothetical protein [Treponemataceae bacterium]